MNVVYDKPMLVSATRALEILDIGTTKFWAMVKASKIEMADTGVRRMVVYASLERLATPNQEAA